jgi:hypothetical protein
MSSHLSSASSLRSWLPVASAVLALALSSCRTTAGTQTPEPAQGQPLGQPPTLHVRQEVHQLSASQIDAYRKGVALMMKRDAKDPRSWIYQANIHGFPTENTVCQVTPLSAQPAWSTCQHGNFFFLAWHRMYLYYFEQILRSSVREALGDPNYEFSLPYWDYENAAYHDLPEPFRSPADASNSLYVQQRAANCNAGQECVSATTASAAEALKLTPFCNCPQGQTCAGCASGLLPDQAFGSQFTAAPVHLSGSFGELESQPHNVVHDAVGGETGWMAYVECAARDPIFWLHHANIDRLWQVWLNEGGRQNPLGADNWKTQTFTFFDENAQEVKMTGCQVLNMATQLNYQYEGLPVQNVTLCSETGAQPEAGVAAAAPQPPKVLTESRAAETKLGNEPVSVSVPMPSGVADRMSALAEGREAKGMRLVIEGLRRLRPGAFYQVYINLPAGQKPDPSGPYFVGNIGLFGSDHHGGAEVNRSFDITDDVRRLREQGQWSGQLQVTIVRGNLAGAPNATQKQEFVSFRKISVIEQ